MEENDRAIKKTIVHEGVQYDGKLKSVALMVKDLQNSMTSRPQNNKCCHFLKLIKIS